MSAKGLAILAIFAAAIPCLFAAEKAKFVTGSDNAKVKEYLEPVLTQLLDALNVSIKELKGKASPKVISELKLIAKKSAEAAKVKGKDTQKMLENLEKVFQAEVKRVNRLLTDKKMDTEVSEALKIIVKVIDKTVLMTEELSKSVIPTTTVKPAKLSSDKKGK